jgi:hypothetical protein
MILTGENRITGRQSCPSATSSSTSFYPPPRPCISFSHFLLYRHLLLLPAIFRLLPSSSSSSSSYYYYYWTDLVSVILLLPLLPLPLPLLLLSSKCRDTESLGPAASNYPAANSTCWHVNMEQACHEIWLKEEMYGPTDKPPPLPLFCCTSLSPMRLTPSTCVGKVTSCRLNYRTAQSTNKTKNQMIFVIAMFHPALITSRICWPTYAIWAQ